MSEAAVVEREVEKQIADTAETFVLRGLPRQSLSFSSLPGSQLHPMLASIMLPFLL